MNKADKLRLRRRYDQAQVTEEDLKAALKDWQAELEAADPTYEPLRVELLTAQVEGLKARLKQTQEQVDDLRRQIREHDVPESPTPHPGGGVAAILEADRKRPKWDTGGVISSRDADWEMPEREGRRSR